jgi:hypothetical protein
VIFHGSRPPSVDRFINGSLVYLFAFGLLVGEVFVFITIICISTIYLRSIHRILCNAGYSKKQIENEKQ